MGHLTEIANSLQAVAARRPAVARTLCNNAAWTDFAFGPLAERNQVPLQAFVLAVPAGFTVCWFAICARSAFHSAVYLHSALQLAMSKQNPFQTHQFAQCCALA